MLVLDEISRAHAAQPAAVGALLNLASDARRAGRPPLWAAFTFNPHRADAAALPTGDAAVIDMPPLDLLAVTRVLFAAEGVAEYEAAAELTWGFLAWAKGPSPRSRCTSDSTTGACAPSGRRPGPPAGSARWARRWGCWRACGGRSTAPRSRG